jgi:hypothetical protein
VIWYDCGDGWLPANWARKDLWLDAILCCPGPSLKTINLDSLKGPGRKVFAINTAYPTVKPDMWLGMDEMHCYDANLLDEPFPKVFRGTYSEMSYQGQKVKHSPETYFADVAKVPAGKTMLELRAANTKFAWHNHTLGVALHMMIWMGAKNIYLVGCDMGGEKDYCHELTLTPEQRSRNHKLYAQQVIFLEKLAKAAKSYGITIWSSTPDSPINKCLPYKDISEVTTRTLKPSKPRYVTDRPCVPVTVLKSGGEYTAAHVQRLASQVPGLVCLSDVEVPGVPCVPIKKHWPRWWSKIELFGPAFDTDILHIDLDTTVLGDISEFLKVGKTTMLRDFYHKGVFASGLMYIHQDDKKKVFDAFCADSERIMAKHKSPPLLGDQGFLTTVLKPQAWQDVLPKKVVSYRVMRDKPPEGAVIICYFGKDRPWSVNGASNF